MKRVQHDVGERQHPMIPIGIEPREDDNPIAYVGHDRSESLRDEVSIKRFRRLGCYMPEIGEP